MKSVTIDSHQHFWTLSAPWCDWPTEAEAAIHRDYAPEDLEPLLRASGVDKTILVQAAPDIDETRSLLAIATNTAFVAGVVGWVDFENSKQAADDISALSEDSHFVGVRPMLQSIEATDWILCPEFDPIFKALIANEIVFDALIQPRHLSVTAKLAARYPALKIVIDHAAKPSIANRSISPWAEGLLAAAQHSNISCKLSGLLTEAKAGDGAAALQSVVDKIIAAFGLERILWGSDWPVVEMNGDYAGWYDMANTLLAPLSESEKGAIFGGNAARLYNPPL